MRRNRLIGIRRINKIINRYVRKWGLKAELFTDFCYDSPTETIGWSLVCPQDNAKMFVDFFEERGLHGKADLFLLSLFHEIGHANTINLLSEADWNYSQDRKAEENIDYAEYLRLPDEIYATDWAVNYLLEKSEEVAELWEKLASAIQRFYKLNHITEK